MKGNNKLIDIQEMLMSQMKRLNDDETMKNDGENEIKRCNALSNNALTYLKAVNVNIKIREIAEKEAKLVENINKELGLSNNEE